MRSTFPKAYLMFRSPSQNLSVKASSNWVNCWRSPRVTAGRVVANANLLTVLPRHFVQVTGFADQLVLRPLPFDVSAVHVDAVWHRRSQQRSSHVWLREAVLRAANKAFRPATIPQ